jgi:UDP-glucose:(heptosyl)LPS alpha-1,3-glucosyltransferase
MTAGKYKFALAARRAAGWSGAARIVAETARGLAARGHRVEVVAERVDGELYQGAGVVPVKIMGWPWGHYVKRVWFARRAAAHFRRSVPDVVHGHGDLLDQDILSLHNCVHAAHEAVHGRPLPGDSGVGRLHEFQLRGGRFRRLIANSLLMKNDLVSRFGVDPGRVTVIYPGYDPGRFRPADRERYREAVRAEWGVRPGEKVVGLITSGDLAKRGLGIFMETLARLPAELNARLHAVVVAKDPSARRTGDAFAGGWGGRFHWVAPLATVERFYHAVDVYIHPAHFEEFGMTVREAMACGTPVLTSRRVGAAETWPGEAAEWVLEAPDARGFAALLEDLLRHPDRARALGERLVRATAGQDWTSYFARTWEEYERVLNREKA